MARGRSHTRGRRSRAGALRADPRARRSRPLPRGRRDRMHRSPTRSPPLALVRPVDAGRSRARRVGCPPSESKRARSASIKAAGSRPGSPTISIAPTTACERDGRRAWAPARSRIKGSASPSAVTSSRWRASASNLAPSRNGMIGPSVVHGIDRPSRSMRCQAGSASRIECRERLEPAPVGPRPRAPCEPEKPARQAWLGPDRQWRGLARKEPAGRPREDLGPRERVAMRSGEPAAVPCARSGWAGRVVVDGDLHAARAQGDAGAEADHAATDDDGPAQVTAPDPIVVRMTNRPHPVFRPYPSARSDALERLRTRARRETWGRYAGPGDPRRT